ncbi:WD repeat domain phosphoinositide-interacting protein 3 [Ichthyophthirius multifiliis]|uniref:WD repeat domain phosphoinositide-interacting protein 3 n=1 Tax=Ichthyophthirius multifiliis TaxID=5932 RepID=G0R4U3_ICHMU|nr:WD repeat domain phosphoinositide-interacting protein 3 [Ichthyophthirius multifiliis]EGR27531.1 WD repeat domain phosphoinositide-interacting protein 3 [Ichthyophthirius multifiliis]|eukprot:XP_004024983.1 WD repeat domain phosphoinositide-interacting protein 3 [Ichthyophthirius multifiliis]
MEQYQNPQSQQQNEEILYLSFNQDQECFSCGTEQGFVIYNTDPFQHIYNRDFGGGIGIVEMLNRCNIIALVGGGKQPKFAPTKVQLWDDNQLKRIAEMNFRSEVKGVKLRETCIIVVLETKIYAHNFSDLRLFDTINTCPNPLGLCSINTKGNFMILASPHKNVGEVNVKFYEEDRTVVIKAHQSALNCLQLNHNGSKLATASQKGTLIRIYNTQKGEILQELRRGSEYAQIYSIAFHPKGKYVACSSDSGTIHIFMLLQQQGIVDDVEENNQEVKQNPKSTLKFLKFIVPYFDNERSFAQCKIGEYKSKITFDQNNGIIAITYQGQVYQGKFNVENGGEFVPQCFSMNKQDQQ